MFSIRPHLYIPRLYCRAPRPDFLFASVLKLAVPAVNSIVFSHKLDHGGHLTSSVDFCISCARGVWKSRYLPPVSTWPAPLIKLMQSVWLAKMVEGQTEYHSWPRLWGFQSSWTWLFL